MVVIEVGGGVGIKPECSHAPDCTIGKSMTFSYTTGAATSSIQVRIAPCCFVGFKALKPAKQEGGCCLAGFKALKPAKQEGRC